MKPWAKYSVISLFFLWIGSVCLYMCYVSNTLSQPPLYSFPPFDIADEMVVLTGGRNRMEAAFSLSKIYRPKNMFISGVSKKATLEDIKFLAAEPISPEINVILGKKATNTRENALEVDNWVKQNNISRILLVTSDYHMKRSIQELKDVNPQLTVVPCPIKSDFDWRFVWICIKEAHKLTYVLVRNYAKKVLL